MGVGRRGGKRWAPTHLVICRSGGKNSEWEAKAGSERQKVGMGGPPIGREKMGVKSKRRS